MFLTVTAIIADARYVNAITTIWSDGVLRRLAGWLSVPDNSTLGRLFKTFRASHVSQLETLNHKMWGKIWRMALRNGRSTIAVMPCRTIDVDSKIVSPEQCRQILLQRESLGQKIISIQLPETSLTPATIRMLQQKR